MEKVGNATANSSWINRIDEQVKNDHVRGLDVLFRSRIKPLERFTEIWGSKEVARPVYDTLDAFVEAKELEEEDPLDQITKWNEYKERKPDVFSCGDKCVVATMVYILPMLLMVPNVMYHVVAVVGNLFQIFIKPIVLLYQFGFSSQGFKELTRAFFEKICDVLTNVNQLILSAISAIPLVGSFIGYGYSFTQVVILNLPGINFLARKVDGFIHPTHLLKPKCSILYPAKEVEMELIAFGIHAKIGKNNKFRSFRQLFKNRFHQVFPLFIKDHFMSVKTSAEKLEKMRDPELIRDYLK